MAKHGNQTPASGQKPQAEANSAGITPGASVACEANAQEPAAASGTAPGAGDVPKVGGAEQSAQNATGTVSNDGNGAAPQNGAAETTPASNEEGKGSKPASEQKPQTGNAPEGKMRIIHAGLKGKKIGLANGKIAEFDEEGVCEIDIEQAARLLRIPGYKAFG